jgi:uncharacterized membrane protein
MKTTRLEAYSDAVIAIVITIMVLELRPPEGEGFAALGALLPTFLAYVLSFAFLSIYWNNHHHLLQATEQVNGTILWANIHLLFWLSLVPFTTAWMSEHPGQSAPTALYGLNLLMAAVAYTILTYAIIALQGRGSALARALGRDSKGKLSLLLYLLAIAAAFFRPAVAYAFYVVVALMWLIPDRRIEAALPTRKEP